MRVVIAMLAIWMGTTGLVGCRKQIAAPRPGRPPLKVSFRKSQIPTEGMVAGINNPSSSESIQVVAVFAQGKGEKEQRSYRIDRELKPLDSIAVGWVQLTGWSLKPGDNRGIR